MNFLSPIRDISSSIEKQKKEFELKFDARKGILSEKREPPETGRSKGLAWLDDTEGTEREDRGGLTGCLL